VLNFDKNTEVYFYASSFKQDPNACNLNATQCQRQDMLKAISELPVIAWHANGCIWQGVTSS